MKKVSIFGCGWVGKSLAHTLKSHYEVNCSVRSSTSYDALEMENKFLLFGSTLFNSTFYAADVIVIAIPPRDEYLKTLKLLLSFISPNTQIILLSSTSVYPQTQGMVKEEHSNEASKPTPMLQAEYLVQSLREDVLILRLGGLMGYERIAGKYTAGKTKAHDTLVNYIHRDDVVKVITLCISKQMKGEVFNVVAPQHPKQSELYTQNAKDFTWENTYYHSHKVTGKTVSSLKLVKHFHYTFLKPNPMAFWK